MYVLRPNSVHSAGRTLTCRRWQDVRSYGNSRIPLFCNIERSSTENVGTTLRDTEKMFKCIVMEENADSSRSKDTTCTSRVHETGTKGKFGTSSSLRLQLHIMMIWMASRWWSELDSSQYYAPQIPTRSDSPPSSLRPTHPSSPNETVRRLQLSPDRYRLR
jgi:hypothetical protein